MFCNNCGTKINPGDGFCTKCGTPAQGVTINTTTVNSVVNPEDNKKANNLCILSLILKYGVGIVIGIIFSILSSMGNYTSSSAANSIGSAIAVVLYGLSGISEIAALVIMIIVRVKYPKNVFGKVLMWIYIVEIILAMLSIIILFAMCYSIISSCYY